MMLTIAWCKRDSFLFSSFEENFYPSAMQCSVYYRSDDLGLGDLCIVGYFFVNIFGADKITQILEFGVQFRQRF